MKVIVRRWQFDLCQSTLGTQLITLTHHDHSWQWHQGSLTKRWHRPFETR